MPAYKHKPSPQAKRRDFWGDIIRGTNLNNLIELKFGKYHGSVKHVLAYLKIQRRLLDMYKSGERAIPDDIFARLNLLKDYNPKRGHINDWANEVDPLS